MIYLVLDPKDENNDDQCNAMCGSVCVFGRKMIISTYNRKVLVCLSVIFHKKSLPPRIAIKKRSEMCFEFFQKFLTSKQKQCNGFATNHICESTGSQTRKRGFYIPDEYEIVFENSVHSFAAILAEHL